MCPIATDTFYGNGNADERTVVPSARRRAPGMRTHELLVRSPTYTEDCDLYPQRMREVLNQSRGVAFAYHSNEGAPARPPSATPPGERPRLSLDDIEANLRLYPAAIRLFQI